MKNIPWNYLVFIFLFGVAVGCKSKKKVADITTPQESAPSEVVEKTPEKEYPDHDENIKTVEKEVTTERKLTEYLTAISTAPSTTSANKTIGETLNMFSSPDALVLIIISESDGIKDYDRPTTIQKYLNYLKDQKKEMDEVHSIKKDANGKITELELKK
ncbi:nucleoid-structuring protein H-NS [Fulvivirga sp. M361]|uniref:nucleoid-structuring protein H-NS n=1 Tax=Fulvivirga sp. M361 TaxID=2594266 RepID=UPI00117A6A79|nr:nucleoid-structuring protein H-NS [Fulvivirga sp. M361]TRX48593.1 nucleoid-structuring protein H-NS [Fulvivirga sp. M361]